MTEVTFTRTNATGKGNFVHNKHGLPPIVFKAGVFKTSDRDIIMDLLRSDEMRRGYIKCTTDMGIVDKWLKGEEPDKLTKEVLAKLTPEGCIELAKVIQLDPSHHNNYPEVIRAMAIGEPLTNAIYQVLQNYSKEKPTEDLLQSLIEEGLIYKNGPWYKFKKTEDESKHLALGKTDAEAHRWISENKGYIDEVRASVIEEVEEDTETTSINEQLKTEE